ncbi:MAG: DnaJ domain-containing protein, partial [Dehalococcoidia bacterium]|nr:DnaJ domain-containing protein [Dehalococcoidia bacterium]
MKQTLTYFSLLGISEDASQEDLEARYRELADYLASPNVPAGLREWAARQAALVDEAYAVLADPEQRAAVHKSQERTQA